MQCDQQQCAEYGVRSGRGRNVEYDDARWWNGSSPDVAWNNAQFDTAVFGGLAGGTVTSARLVVAGGLTFNTGGYVIQRPRPPIA